MPARLDRLLVVAAAVLLVAIAWDALRRGPGPPPAATRTTATTRSRPPAPVPERVRLVPSDTAFLPRCPAGALHLAVGPGRVVRLRFRGPRCHVPPLHLRAVARTRAGETVYDGPALAHEELSGNYAVAGAARGRLLVPCRTQPLRVAVSGSGLAARGLVRCSRGS